MSPKQKGLGMLPGLFLLVGGTGIEPVTPAV